MLLTSSHIFMDQVRNMDVGLCGTLLQIPSAVGHEFIKRTRSIRQRSRYKHWCSRRVNIVGYGCLSLLAKLVGGMLLTATVVLADDTQVSLSVELEKAITAHSGGHGLSAFRMPASTDYRDIPQDPDNPITKEKARLGQLLFHEAAVATEGTELERTQTWSCASCHHLAAGFKAGILQGIGDGGTGFGLSGEARRLVAGLDASAPDGDSTKPDVQPIASPTVLNTAYQDVMLWNGSFGNAPGSVNEGIAHISDAGPEAILANTFGLSGLETQALAGTKVHRLRFDNWSIVQSNSEYRYLYEKAYPNGDSGVIPNNGTTVSSAALGAAKAIAAYERTVLSNYAPFQKWLTGEKNAMTPTQLRGGLLFFGKAGCVSCHTGPALSSRVAASENEMFFAVGFNDFDPNHPQIHGAVDDDTKKGRGGFTGVPSDNYKFKIPQLYNLADSQTLGHGSSFRSVREVIEYKNNGIAENPMSADNLAEKFTPLFLNSQEIDDLTAFVEEALYDKWLHRYVPSRLPSSACFPVADFQSAVELECLTSGVYVEEVAACQYTDSDSDGDGWGWELYQSCRVVDGLSKKHVDGMANRSDYPSCQFNNSDPDGDGWGWEYMRSCKVLEYSGAK